MAEIPRLEIVQEFRVSESFAKALPELIKVAEGSCSCSCNCSCLCQCSCQCSGLDLERLSQLMAIKG